MKAARKALAIALSLVLAFGVFGSGVFAEDTPQVAPTESWAGPAGGTGQIVAKTDQDFVFAFNNLDDNDELELDIYLNNVGTERVYADCVQINLPQANGSDFTTEVVNTLLGTVNGTEKSNTIALFKAAGVVFGENDEATNTDALSNAITFEYGTWTLTLSTESLLGGDIEAIEFLVAIKREGATVWGNNNYIGYPDDFKAYAYTIAEAGEDPEKDPKPVTEYTITADIADKEFIAGNADGTEIDVTLKGDGNGETSYSAVRFKIEITQKPDDDSKLELWAKDSNGNDYDVASVGFWGPSSGFAIDKDYDVTTTFTVKADKAGKYKATIMLLDISDSENPAEITSETFKINVTEKEPEPEPVTEYTITAGIADKEFIAGNAEGTPIDVSLKGDGKGAGFDKVRFKIEVTQKPDDSKLELWAKDSNGNDYDVAEVGFWGPSSGFEIDQNYDETTTFTVKADKSGDYTATITLLDVSDDSNTVITSETFKITVTEKTPDPKPVTEYTITAGIADKEFIAGNAEGTPIDVSLKGDGKGAGFDKVRFKIEITQKPDDDSKLELWAKDSNGNDYDVASVGFWGPSSGFAIDKDYNVTTTFTVKADKAGEYKATISLLDVSDDSNTVITSETFKITVTEKTPDPKPDTVTVRVKNTAGGYILAYTETQDENHRVIARKYLPVEEDVEVDKGTNLHLSFIPDESQKIILQDWEDATYENPDIAKMPCATKFMVNDTNIPNELSESEKARRIFSTTITINENTTIDAHTEYVTESAAWGGGASSHITFKTAPLMGPIEADEKIADLQLWVADDSEGRVFLAENAVFSISEEHEEFYIGEDNALYAKKELPDGQIYKIPIAATVEGDEVSLDWDATLNLKNYPYLSFFYTAIDDISDSITVNHLLQRTIALKDAAPEISMYNYEFKGWSTAKGGELIKDMGSYQIEQRKEITNFSKFRYFDFYANFDYEAPTILPLSGPTPPPPPPPPPPPSGGSGSSGGSSGSSSSWITIPSRSSNVASDGSVSLKAVLGELAAATGTRAELRVQNAESITADTLKQLAAQAAQSGKRVTVHADTMDGGAVQGRLYVQPALLANANAGIKLGVFTTPAKTQAVTGLFDHFFNNTIRTIACEQQGAFGARLEIAVKVDLTGLNFNSLHFYSYNAATNTYARITRPAYWMDANGYLHFNTALAGNIVITDKPLTLKK